MTATARKLAILIYRTLKDGPSMWTPAPRCTTRNTGRTSCVAYVTGKRPTWDLGLVNLTTGEIAEETVSWEPARFD